MSKNEFIKDMVDYFDLELTDHAKRKLDSMLDTYAASRKNDNVRVIYQKKYIKVFDARNVRGSIEGQPVVYDMDLCAYSVCDAWGITHQDLIGMKRNRHLVIARIDFVHRIKKTFPFATLAYIGAYLGGRHHTTIIYLLREGLKPQINDQLPVNNESRNQMC